MMVSAVCGSRRHDARIVDIGNVVSPSPLLRLENEVEERINRRVH